FGLFFQKCSEFSFHKSSGSKPADFWNAARASSFNGVKRSLRAGSADSKWNSATSMPSQSYFERNFSASLITVLKQSGFSKFMRYRQSMRASASSPFSRATSD